MAGAVHTECSKIAHSVHVKKKSWLCETSQNSSKKCSRGTYLKTQVDTACPGSYKYAVENSNQMTVHQCSKRFCAEIKETKYLWSVISDC